MQHLLPAMTLCLAVTLALTGGTATPAERGAAQSPHSDRLVNLVDKLEHPDFAVREQASGQLLQEGADVIPMLTEVALVKPPEAATRAMHLLETHLVSETPADFEPADDALQQLADSERNFVALGAAGILSRHTLLREQRAVAAIRKLGGTVRYGLESEPFQQWQGPMLMPVDDPLTAIGLRPSDIVIGSDWTGGTAGLKYLRRLGHRKGLQLYVVRDSGVPLAEAEKLSADLPDLIVQERGAYLGVASLTTSDSTLCIVGEVIPDGPGGLAGLQSKDVIRELDGNPVTSFLDLIEKLIPHSAGEQVTMTIDRPLRREVLTLKVELGKWDLPELTPNAAEYLRSVEERRAAEQRRQSDPLEDDADHPIDADQIPLFER